MIMCEHCEEPIEPGTGTGVPGLNLHNDCSIRMVVGSIGCVQRLCPNCGDPPDMTTRQAAKAAADAYRKKHNHS